MNKLISYKDTAFQCWSRVNLDNGDPIYIGIASTSIVVRRGRFGLFGKSLYVETNLDRMTKACIALEDAIDIYTIPDMNSPVLRVFTQATMDSDSADSLSIQLNAIKRDDQISC